MTQILAECLDNKDKVSVWGLDKDWVDIGRPQDLAKARGL